MGMRIGFIGVGEIASAMVEGLNKGVNAGDAESLSFLLSPRNAQRASDLAAAIPSAEVCASNQDVVDRSDLIVLAVLPQQTEAVLDELDIAQEKTVVSAVAGVSTESLTQHLPLSPIVVRIIPLPAVRERKGVTAMFPPNEEVEQLLAVLGGSVTAETETMFSTLSAVTATMSAHFAFLKTITSWLVERGWNSDDADLFIRGQFVGLGTTLAETDDSIDELVAAHETPGGLNEMLNREWMDEANRSGLATALDRIYARVTSSN